MCMAPLPVAAQTPDPSGRAVDVRCKAGVPFKWRIHGSGHEFQESRSNQERLPAFDTLGNPLVYDMEVDTPADWWHRYHYRSPEQGIRVVESLSRGVELNPALVLDTRRIFVAAFVPFFIVTVLAAVQLGRARRLRTQLVETNVRLSEAEARTGLFPLDGSAPANINGYEVVGKLGMGGMAVVYKVRRDGQEYALKLPLPNMLEETDFRARFGREMKLGSTLQHPNLIHIYEVNDGEGDFGYPYMVMELVTGVSLKERMQIGSFNHDKVVRLGMQVLDALAHIHARGIIHRDVKPGNVMVTASGNAKLMDFGIAYEEGTQGRLTSTGDLLGTPLYLAPEQIGGDHQSTDPRIDVYGVGLMLYEALAGRLPWSSRDSVAAVLEKVSYDPPSLCDFRPDVPTGLAECVMRMIARDPADRYPDATQARNALQRALATARS